MAFGPGRKLGLSVCKASAGSGSPNWATYANRERGIGRMCANRHVANLLEESWESSTGWCWQEERVQLVGG
jgi:hypothetical protein